MRTDNVSAGNAQGYEFAGVLAWPNLAGNAAYVCIGLQFTLTVVEDRWRQVVLVCIGLGRHLLLTGGGNLLLPNFDGHLHACFSI